MKWKKIKYSIILFNSILLCKSSIDLWNILDERNIPYYDKLSNYIKELDTIDANGMALRYGLSKSFDAPNETFQFNIDIMICNAMYLINILTEYVVQSYLYKSNEGKSDSDCLWHNNRKSRNEGSLNVWLCFKIFIILMKLYHFCDFWCCII